MDKAQLLDRIGPQFELDDVEYTSPTDAVAGFTDQRGGYSGTVIATTNDNWAHASRLHVSSTLADLVSYTPLGDGAVAVKARRQFPRRNYPGFVLYPNGRTKPLRVLNPQERGRGDVFLDLDRWDSILFDLGRVDTRRLWAADVSGAEVYPVEGTRFGDVWQHVPGRRGAILSVQGFERRGQQWRFESSTDRGHTWSTTMADLPAGRSAGGPDFNGNISGIAVGPGHLQATVSTTSLEDAPSYVNALWQTEDEKRFRQVPLPWDRPFFGGVAYAADGALLFAQVTGPDTYCQKSLCTRPGTIWRFPRGSTTPELLAGAPALFGAFWSVGIYTSGGVIVARTGMRTIAISHDGYQWTPVTPG
ncbi:hypothetical protein SFC79_16520 [Nocardioides sp. S-58]|uniref:Exo-alpha-sialidase n=1 Tax=Nocardioides renjunii TaxID=3095075 RepID=A0ABU5KFL9_9ACTN|nr:MULTISPECIES: hypothetical protein [unclassified Nocardioides]MDZ5663380.1 hypothetical protein [Nocardioides sp. S-58]WQQ22749.1 hypothetical protein SHK17_01945 [Nocardioides sp. S-34]